MIQLDVKWNDQKDNIPLPRLPGSSQCGYTSAAMMVSPFIPAAATDDFVHGLIMRMEPAYGRATLADMILDRIPWAHGKRLGMFGDAYAVACRELLRERGLNAELVWRPTGGSASELEAALMQGSPAMLSTMITRSGHYICVVGCDDEHWICHDPYGDGFRGYRQHVRGAYVKYPRVWLEARARKSDPNRRGLRFMYIKRGSK